MYGSQFIYQAMPRMLTLWLDYGAEVMDISPKIRNEVQLHSMRTVVSQLNVVGYTLACYDSWYWGTIVVVLVTDQRDYIVVLVTEQHG